MIGIKQDEDLRNITIYWVTSVVKMTLTATIACIPHMHLHLSTPKESFCSCRHRHRSQSSRGMLTYSGLPERKERRGLRGGRHPLKHFISIIQSSIRPRGAWGRAGTVATFHAQHFNLWSLLLPSPLRALNEVDKHHKRAERT